MRKEGPNQSSEDLRCSTIQRDLGLASFLRPTAGLRFSNERNYHGYNLMRKYSL